MMAFTPLMPLTALWRLKVKNRPLILSHAINSKCNLHCKFCPYWEEDRGEISGEEVFSLLEEAKSLGIILYNAWTVEPLLRKDLPEILKHAHHLGMITSLVTNGVLLKKRAKELSDLDHLSVSVDGIESYEEMRGVKLDKVLDGIKEARDRGITTVINCVISGKNLDEIEELIHLAQELGVWISFEPIHEYEDIPQEVWEDIGIRNMGKYGKIIDRIIELKEEGFPVINSKTYLRMIKSLSPDFRCHASDIVLDVTSDGRIETCRV
ncbi:MAG: radical SAM protein, partial [Methanocellales archaeon]|nr:radical SAM protein [Methanocellales archaeon]